MERFSLLSALPLLRRLPLLLVLLGVVGCPETCVPVTDAGPDAGDGDGDGDGDGGSGDGDGDGDGDLDAGPACDENTEGFGDPCAAMQGDPLCGSFLCCTEGNPLCEEGQLLFCYDLGPNDCGGCGELDTTEGRIGETCGEFGCGLVVCGEDGTSTVCEGDHEPNVCGGCLDILVDAEPGDICSTCMTGVQTCTRDDNDLECWRGRAPDNICGGCDRCIIAHAWMDERFGGSYLKAGTLALIEDIGNGTIQLVFDPLVEGPGTNGLPRAQILLNDSPDIDGLPSPLSPFFAEALEMVPADPVRSYPIPSAIDPANFTHLLIFDYFLGTVVSAGELIPGAPPGYMEPPLDAGTPDDGGMTLVDGGAPPADGGGPTDGGPGPIDAGSPVDAGPADGGPGPVDAGGPPDAGPAPDAGSLDAGTLDAG